MSCCFDKVINRKGTDSMKWNCFDEDAIPLWVADMDFESPQPIVQALIKRAQEGVYGYPSAGDHLNDAIINYYKTEHKTTVLPEWIVWLPNVNVSVNVACRTVQGDLLMNTPIYSHIYGHLPKECGKKRVAVPLKEVNGLLTFDFEAMQTAVQENKVGVFILCNPHNPVGRSYRKQELEDLLDFAEKNDIFIVSDEIHSDLVWGKDAKHIPFFTLGERAQKNSITIHAATKTYNIPGIPAGFAIVPDAGIRACFNNALEGLLPSSSAFAIAAYKAAFTQCEPWRQDLLNYLRDNDAYIQTRFNAIEGLQLTKSESTYLGWIDARETGLENPFEFFLKEANVRFCNGADFGAPGFIRVNFGCPRSVLETAFNQVEQALANR